MGLKLLKSRNIILLFVAVFLFGCASKKDIVYFQNATDYETIVSNNTYNNKFKIDDVVSIYVSTLDPQASMPFNLYRAASEDGYRPEQIDYIIDKNGDIDFPVLGAVNIAGLTPEETKTLLKEKLIALFKRSHNQHSTQELYGDDFGRSSTSWNLSS